MAAEAQRHWTVDDYLAFERQSETKHEYLDGEIVAMSGASRAHGRISWNIGGLLYPQLEAAGCEGFVGDMRVAVLSAESRYTYPDVVVVCGEPQFEDTELDTLLNPTWIVEILSPSTEDKDRGRKLFDYRAIPSLRAILLIAQDQVHVEQFLRQPDGSWLLTDTEDLDEVLEVPGVDVRLSLKDLYQGVSGVAS